MPRGDIASYLDDRLAFFAARGNGAGTGPVARLRLNGPGYLLKEPEDIHHVLVKNHGNYVKSRRLATSRAAYPNPHSLLTSAGQEHRDRRRTVQTAFRRPLTERLAERARVNSANLADSLHEGDEVDVAATMTTVAQRNILETLLSDAGDSHLDQLAAANRARTRAFERHFVSIFPLLEYVPTRFNRAHLRATHRLRAAATAEIQQRRANGHRPDDLLSTLLETGLSDADLRDEVLTISLTGYESVSEALQWTLYLLARHPAVDAQVAAEVTDSGDDLPCLTSVIRESLRLFPPTWMFVRIAQGDDTLPSGVAVPAKAKVYLCPYVVHRDARFWPEPDEFHPDRSANGRPKYAYFPFGGGTHVCIGEALAMVQIVTVLTTLLKSHRLTLDQGTEVRPIGGLTLRPRHGLTMRVEPRAP